MWQRLDSRRGRRHGVLLGLQSDADRLADQDHRDPAIDPLPADDQDLTNERTHVQALADDPVLVRENMLVDALERLVEVAHDLLAADDENKPASPAGVGAELTRGGRGDDQVAAFGDRLDAAQHVIGRRRQLPNLATLGLAVHRQGPGPHGVVAARLKELTEETEILQGLGFSGVHLGPLGDELEHKAARVPAGLDDTDVDVVALQGRHDLLDRRRSGQGVIARQFGLDRGHALVRAGSFASTSTNSPSMLIRISWLTMNVPSSIASKLMQKSLRLILVSAA